MLSEFLSIVAPNGKVNPKRLKRSYFEKQNKEALYDWFNEVTSHSTKTLTDKINLALLGYLETYPKCKVCGKEVSMNRKVPSLYCSKECALKDADRNKKISQTKKGMDSTSSNEKRKQTMLEKYGVEYNSQRKDIHHKWTDSRLDESISNKLEDRDWLYEEYVVKERPSVDIANELGCDYSVILRYCRLYGFKIRQHYDQSKIEKEIVSFIKGLGIEVEEGKVGLYSDNREVDIYIPSKKVGIEVNGLYWHTEQFRNRDYHRRKKFDLKDIRLIQFTDKQWNERGNICRSIILNALGLSKKIGARECTIEAYDSVTKEIRSFFEANHMDGFVGGFKYILLRYNDEILAGIILGRSRFHKENQTELLRYVCKQGIQIQGALNRLISHYRKEHKETILSYVNLSLFDATLYRNNPSWAFKGYSDLGYFWTDGNEIISRYKAMKKNLASWLKDYDSSKSESENMRLNGYHRYFDCGNAIYVNHG